MTGNIGRFKFSESGMKIAMVVVVVVVVVLVHVRLEVASERYRGIFLIEDEPLIFLSGHGR
jgi:hypothetical protein